MASINISIKKEVYDFLRSFKTGNKSFSDVILDLRRNKSPLDFFGVLSEKDWEASEKKMLSFRKSFQRKLGK